jgi:hypothetical protein
MIKLDNETKQQLLAIFKSKRIALEGNILKMIEEDSDEEFKTYLDEAKRLDTESRRKRLDITKKIQSQNNELTKAQAENLGLMDKLKAALTEAQDAKIEAEQLRDAAVEDLDTYQKRAQFEMIGLIVRVALMVVIGVGVVTTGLYVFAMINRYDTKILESAWSNMFGILLTNSFSIIGTIMGVKYATSDNKSRTNE